MDSIRAVLKTAFDSKIEDFFRLARKPTDAYFYRLIGGFRRPGGKKTILAKMGFENCPLGNLSGFNPSLRPFGPPPFREGG